MAMKRHLLGENLNNETAILARHKGFSPKSFATFLPKRQRALFFILPLLLILGVSILSSKIWPITLAHGMGTSIQLLQASSSICNNLLVLVDKTHGLPKSYEPPDLVPLADYSIPVHSPSTILGRQIMINDLQRLFADIRHDGLTGLAAVSVYRSYEQQASVYNSYMHIYGVARADTFSARPGHSQHQLGTTIDFSTSEMGINYGLSDVFAETKAGQWLMANAYKYGFFLAYPQGQERVTGYKYEPWHYRYIGVQNALELKQSGLIMQTYLTLKGIRPQC